jgi:hypothetical protein
MQTVNFQCGHCGNLMAVSVENLGQQVRCPTCHQVVIAPAVTAAAPPEAPREPGPFDDVFTPPEQPEVPVFDADAPAPLEVHHQLPSEEATLPIPPATARDNGAATLPWDPPADLHSPPETPHPLSAEPPAQPVVVTPRGREGRGVNWFLPLVLLPLILYAAAATAVAAYLYTNWRPSQPSLFDQLPDVEGDAPGVRKDRKRVRLNISRELALRPLPEHLHVRLGDTIQVGDLQVTPRRVERRKIALLTETAPDRPEPSPADALVLTLSLKNCSADYSFTPLDNYFDRMWKPGDESVPLTVLVAGQEAFFGGPARWFPADGERNQRNRRGVRQWLQGRKANDTAGLAPGDSAETIVATDGWNEKAAAYLFGTDAEGQRVGAPYRGKLLWRVQLRRGLVPWRGREMPATTVIGVEFDDAAYARTG